MASVLVVLPLPAVLQITLMPFVLRAAALVSNLGGREERPFLHHLKSPLSTAFLLKWKRDTSDIARET